MPVSLINNKSEEIPKKVKKLVRQGRNLENKPKQRKPRVAITEIGCVKTTEEIKRQIQICLSRIATVAIQLQILAKFMRESLRRDSLRTVLASKSVGMGVTFLVRIKLYGEELVELFESEVLLEDELDSEDIENEDLLSIENRCEENEEVNELELLVKDGTPYSGILSCDLIDIETLWRRESV